MTQAEDQEACLSRGNSACVWTPGPRTAPTKSTEIASREWRAHVAPVLSVGLPVLIERGVDVLVSRPRDVRGLGQLLPSRSAAGSAPACCPLFGVGEPLRRCRWADHAFSPWPPLRAASSGLSASAAPTT